MRSIRINKEYEILLEIPVFKQMLANDFFNLSKSVTLCDCTRNETIYQ